MIDDLLGLFRLLPSDSKDDDTGRWKRWLVGGVILAAIGALIWSLT